MDVLHLRLAATFCQGLCMERDCKGKDFIRGQESQWQPPCRQASSAEGGREDEFAAKWVRSINVSAGIFGIINVWIRINEWSWGLGGCEKCPWRGTQFPTKDELARRAIQWNYRLDIDPAENQFWKGTGKARNQGYSNSIYTNGRKILLDSGKTHALRPRWPGQNLECYRQVEVTLAAGGHKYFEWRKAKC